MMKASIAFGDGNYASSDGGDMLADSQVEPLDKSRINTPAGRSQQLFGTRQGPIYYALSDVNETAAAAFFNDLCIQ